MFQHNFFPLPSSCLCSHPLDIHSSRPKFCLWLQGKVANQLKLLDTHSVNKIDWIILLNLLSPLHSFYLFAKWLLNCVIMNSLQITRNFIGLFYLSFAFWCIITSEEDCWKYNLLKRQCWSEDFKETLQSLSSLLQHQKWQTRTSIWGNCFVFSLTALKI